MFPKTKTQGFTLIELLVVVSVITFLSSSLFATFNATRAKARDIRRIADIRQVITALELYYDKYGQYPESDNECNGGWDVPSDGDFISELTAEGLLARDLMDPSINNNNGNCGNYQYHRYDDTGLWGCDVGRHYIVLQIIDMESTPFFPGNGGPPWKGSPGWSCAGFNWNTYAEWVWGKYEK